MRKDLSAENAAATGRDLEELQKFMAGVREELKRLGAREEQLLQDTGKAPDAQMGDLEKKQAALAKDLEDALGKAEGLLNADKTKRMDKRQPGFPAEPYVPDADEKKLPIKEADPDDPDAKAKGNGNGEPSGVSRRVPNSKTTRRNPSSCPPWADRSPSPTRALPTSNGR